jgi:hypothetical protein
VVMNLSRRQSFTHWTRKINTKHSMQTLTRDAS